MKKLLMTGAASVLLIAALLTGCNDSKTNATISDTKSATVTEESTEAAVKDILTYAKGIKDLTVEVGAKDVDYLKNVTYDKKYIKSVTVDSSDVKVDTVGKYKLVYTVTPVDTKTDIATVVKTVTVEVTTNDGTTPVDKTSDEVIADNTDDTADNSSNDTQPAKTDDSSSTQTEPAETQHTHSWVAVTKIVTVTDCPATTKQELVTPESWEWVIDKTYKDLYCEQHNITYAQFEKQYPGDDIWLTQIIYDGYMPTSSDDLVEYIMTYVDRHPDYNDGLLGWTSVEANGEVEGHEVHHDAVYKTVNVPAVTHTEEQVVGYKCSGCGATK